MRKILLFIFAFSFSSILIKIESGTARTGHFQDDREVFKREMYARIEKNKERIAEFRLELKDEDPKKKKESKQKIKELEKRNQKLKRKLDNYEDKEDWLKFKKDCNDEMNDLDEAVTDAI